MLHHLPKAPPTFAELADQVAPWDHSGAQLAKALGVSKRTIRRWKKTNGPITARLVLWCLSPHGNNVMRLEMAYGCQITRQQMDALRREASCLRQQLAGHAAAAPRPTPRPDHAAPGLPGLLDQAEARPRPQGLGMNSRIPWVVGHR